MARKVDWEMARQDYLLAKQLQGLSQRTLEDYDNYTGQLITCPTDNKLGFTTSSIRIYLASLTVGQVTLGIRIKVLRTSCRWLTGEGYLQSTLASLVKLNMRMSKVCVVVSEDRLNPEHTA